MITRKHVQIKPAGLGDIEFHVFHFSNSKEFKLFFGILEPIPDHVCALTNMYIPSNPKKVSEIHLTFFDSALNRGKDVFLGVVVHEVVHAVQIYLEYLGIKQSEDTSEVYAYMTDWLFSFILRTTRRWVKK